MGVADETVSLSQDWLVVTAYPKDTAAGEGVAKFTRLLSERKDKRIRPESRFEYQDGIGQLLDTKGGVQMGVLFASDLSKINPVFGLSMRPFEVKSAREAYELMCLAEDAYRRALSQQGFVLLASIPWPPTGIWSSKALTMPADLSGMRVRTYDPTSRSVVDAMGAQAVSLPIQAALAQLVANNLNAVMSSGDGEAGRIFGQHLRHFVALRYAYPLSFLVARKPFLDGLPDDVQVEVTRAAVETEKAAWQALSARIEGNYAQMRQMGIDVSDPVQPALMDELRRVGSTQTEQWMATVDGPAKDLLKAFRLRIAAANMQGCREWIVTER